MDHEPTALERSFAELMRPRYVVAAFIIGIIIGWMTTVQPADAAVPPASQPHRITLHYGDHVAWPHDGPMCWNFKRNRAGRPVAVFKMGERAHRGASCRGPIALRARLPWAVQEDQITAFTLGDRLLLSLTR